MNKKCAAYKQKYIDVFYDESTIDEDTKNHLNTCKEFREYVTELKKVKSKLNLVDMPVSIDKTNIKKAFSRADTILEKKKFRKEIFIFIIVSVLILFSAILVPAFISSKFMLYINLFIYINIPLLLIPLVAIKFKKEVLHYD